MEIKLPPDFKEFLKLLNSHQVEYLLIGGYAVSYHGYPRATNDIDIWIAVHPDNAARMVAVLNEFGFNLAEVSAELFLKVPGIVRIGFSSDANRGHYKYFGSSFRAVLCRPKSQTHLTG